ncbi:hypothetical protein BKA62DRAFT_202190 [Auriculariales sp. MPI-PUGE-AT-0066]|nr:hypothetical protein BKA62DRAFT_202190 [Auriculariales sp. MPI-PUGE-AT-0066]
MSLRMLKRTHSMLDMTSTNHGAQPPYKVARMASFVDAPSMRTAALARTPTPAPPCMNENVPPSTPPTSTKHTPPKSSLKPVLTPPKRTTTNETDGDGDTEPEDNMDVDVEVDTSIDTSRDSETELETDTDSDGDSDTASETDEWSSEDDEFIDDEEDEPAFISRDTRPTLQPAMPMPTISLVANTSPPSLLRSASLPNLTTATNTELSSAAPAAPGLRRPQILARIPLQPARPIASTSRVMLSPAAAASPIVNGRTLAQVDKGLKLRLAFARSAKNAPASGEKHLAPSVAKLARRPFVPIVWPDRGAMVFEPRFVARTRSVLVPVGEPHARRRVIPKKPKSKSKSKSSKSKMDVDVSPKAPRRVKKSRAGNGYTLSSPIRTRHHDLRVLPPTCTEQLRRPDSDELRRVALMTCFGPRKTVKFWDLRSRRISVQ